jgi:hypothetical protein
MWTLLMALSGPQVGGPYGPYKQVSRSYTYNRDPCLTFSSLKEQHYTEATLRNYWILAVPTDVSVLPSDFVH